MMSKITALFLNIFLLLFFGIIGVNYVLHRGIPDVVLGLIAWGIAAMLILHTRFQWIENPPTPPARPQNVDR